MATAAEPLIEELEGYRLQFEESRAEFPKLVAGLDDEQFNWRPQEDRWSMAECIDHLVVVGTMMMRRIDDALEKAEARGMKGDAPFKYGPLGNWFVRSVSGGDAGRKRKFKAPAIYTPSSNHSISRLDAAFNKLQDTYVSRIERSNGLDLARVKLPSAVTRLIRLSLGQWFALLAGHQERHIMQAKEVREKIPAAE